MNGSSRRPGLPACPKTLRGPVFAQALTLPLFLAGASWLTSGCASSRRLPPLDLAAPGWQVKETAAVWQPRAGAPELVGELLVAVHPDGQRLVQFSKQGLPLVTAQSTSNTWQISSSLRSRVYSGNQPAPSRVLWFRVDSLPPHEPVLSPWQLEPTPEAGWVLTQRRTGERLEGAPVPP